MKIPFTNIEIQVIRNSTTQERVKKVEEEVIVMSGREAALQAQIDELLDRMIEVESRIQYMDSEDMLDKIIERIDKKQLCAKIR